MGIKGSQEKKVIVYFLTMDKKALRKKATVYPLTTGIKRLSGKRAIVYLLIGIKDPQEKGHSLPFDEGDSKRIW